jgi:hypothetical protein
MKEFYKVSVDMDSGAMIYIPRFIKIGSDVQKLMGGIRKHTDNMVIDCIRLFLFFRNRESRLKNGQTSFGLPYTHGICSLLYTHRPIISNDRRQSFASEKVT